MTVPSSCENKICVKSDTIELKDSTLPVVCLSSVPESDSVSLQISKPAGSLPSAGVTSSSFTQP